MKGSINAAIIKYVQISNSYKKKAHIRGKDLNSGLDWNVLQMCLFLILPEEILGIYPSAAEFLNELVWQLEYYNITEERPEEDGRCRLVKIEGYIAEGKDTLLSSFYLLLLLIYSHVLEDDREKLLFLESMIVTPCCKKILDCYETESDRAILAEHFGIADVGICPANVRDMMKSENTYMGYVETYFKKVIYMECTNEISEYEKAETKESMREAYFIRMQGYVRREEETSV